MKTMDQEIADTIATFERLGKLYYDNRQRILEQGGVYAAGVAEFSAPKSKRPHFRYNTAKLTKKIRAPKGLGYIKAAYYPGNLGRSINVLKFRRAKSKVYVGAKLSRNSSGIFKGKRHDGYYMHFTENGTKKKAGSHWFRSSWERSKSGTLSIIESAFERIGKDFERKNSIL